MRKNQTLAARPVSYRTFFCAIMDDNKMLTNQTTEQKQNEQPHLPPINDETTRYLWNLAQKSNLTVTTAVPAKAQIFVKQEKNDDPVERMSHVRDSSTNKSVNKMNCKDEKAEKKNPFAALPLSLIKNGILSVTSDSACVRIENGVPILKETAAAPSCTQTNLEKKSAITIEPVPMKIKPGAVATTSLKEKILPKTATRQFIGENKIDQPKAAAIPENKINSGQFQRRMTLQQQILKELFKPNCVRPLPPNTLIPNTNQMEFSALLGLELVTEFCLSEKKPMPKLKKPDICVQCGTDFSPRWHFGGVGSSLLQTFCERCFLWHMRLKNKEERTNQYQTQAKILQKGVILPLNKNKPQPSPEPQQLFKNYLNALITSTVKSYDSNIGFSDLTKLGASIAGNREICECMENLRSLNNAAAPEVRAKAIQNLQLAFFKGLCEVLKITGMKPQQRDSLLGHCQMIVAQLAQRAGLTCGLTAQTTTQRQTGLPLEVFERAIKEHKQRLLKTIQNNKS